MYSYLHTQVITHARTRISPVHMLNINSRSELFVSSRFSPAAMIVVSVSNWNDTKPSRHSLEICRDNTYILKSTQRKGWHPYITDVNITPKACMWLTQNICMICSAMSNLSSVPAFSADITETWPKIFGG